MNIVSYSAILCNENDIVAGVLSVVTTLPGRTFYYGIFPYYFLLIKAVFSCTGYLKTGKLEEIPKNQEGASACPDATI
jgi:hypothetical protein